MNTLVSQSIETPRPEVGGVYNLSSVHAATAISQPRSAAMKLNLIVLSTITCAADISIFEHACQTGFQSATPLPTPWENDTDSAMNMDFCRGEFKKLHESSIKVNEHKYPFNYGGQISGLLKLEAMVVWLGCVMSALTTHEEWNQ